MSSFMFGSASQLHWGHAPFAPERSDCRRNQEEGPRLDENGDRDRLVAVGLEALQLVEHEGAGKPSVFQAVGVEAGGVAGQPEESPLDGAPGDAEDAGSLAQGHAGDHEPQAGGIEIWLLVVPIGAEGLARKAVAAQEAAEALHGMSAAARLIAAVALKDEG
jgi:hypothetical protein